MIDVIEIIMQWERDGEPYYDLPILDSSAPHRRYAWPSSLNLSGYKCDLRSAYEIINATSSDPIPLSHGYLNIPKYGGENHELQRLFAMGNIIEERVVMAVIHSGINFRWNDKLDYGKFDLYFPNENEVVEIKYTTSVLPSLDRLAQIGSYMIELKAQNGQFVFINSKTLEIKSYPVVNSNGLVSLVDDDGMPVTNNYGEIISLSYTDIERAKSSIEGWITIVENANSLIEPIFDSPIGSPCTRGKAITLGWSTQCYGTKANGERCNNTVTSFPACSYHTKQIKNFARKDGVISFLVNGNPIEIDSEICIHHVKVDCPFFARCWKISGRTVDVIVDNDTAGFYDDDGNYARVNI